jgi:uncharacterized membrane protein YsdA (DUF1294 family)
MIAIVGGLLAAFGLVAGALLLAGPLGLVATDVGVALGMLFPVFTVIGWFLLVIGDRHPARVTATRVLSVLVLLLAVCAAGALLAVAAGVVPVHGINGSIPLWVVLILGGVVGAVGTAATNRKPESDPAA